MQPLGSCGWAQNCANAITLQNGQKYRPIRNATLKNLPTSFHHSWLITFWVWVFVMDVFIWKQNKIKFALIAHTIWGFQ